MGWKGTLRAMEAAQRRQQRDAQKRLRELERQSKEEAKLSEKEKARLEVETFENRLEVLSSVHKEQGETWDWTSVAASLPPPAPAKISRNEYRARQLAAVARELGDVATATIERARLQDQEEFHQASMAYTVQLEEWKKFRHLAERIRAGEHKAFTETLVEVNPFSEISDLGSSINFIVHTPKLVEFNVTVNGKQVIPPDVKSLTASGKLSVKQMPKGRFHEIYQEYLCGCVLRIARELLALFPVETVLATAIVKSKDQQTGRKVDLPVLSIAIPRSIIERLDFEKGAAFDLIDNFTHRGDLKASRRSEIFEPIIPLTPEDIAPRSADDLGFAEICKRIKTLRAELNAAVSKLTPNINLMQSGLLP